MTLHILAALVALAVAVSACDSGGRIAAVPGARTGEPLAAAAFDAGLVPAEVAGLRTEREDLTEQLSEVGDESYATVLELWSLREQERLRATLQVTRLAPDARPEDEEFVTRIAGQIGSSELRKRLVGDQVVFVTVSNEQPVYVWFRGLHVLVLTVATDHDAPRALLRTVIEEVRP